MVTVEVARSSMLLMRRVTGENSMRRPSSVARVRRVLFDEPLNHEETRRDLVRETEQLTSEMRHRWNFDFNTETPLQGRYEWRRTTPETVHPAYDLRHITRLAVPSSTVTSAGSATVTSDCSSVSANTEEQKSAPVKTSVKTATASSTKGKSIQKKVTDFMTQRKRPLIKSSNSPSPSPKNKVRRTTT